MNWPKFDKLGKWGLVKHLKIFLHIIYLFSYSISEKILAWFDINEKQDLVVRAKHDFLFSLIFNDLKTLIWSLLTQRDHIKQLTIRRFQIKRHFEIPAFMASSPAKAENESGVSPPDEDVLEFDDDTLRGEVSWL